jgi:hypothetical protein
MFTLPTPRASLSSPLRALLLAASLSAALIGCGRQDEAAPPASSASGDAPAEVAAKAPPAETAAPASEQGAGAKLQGYIECYNQVDEGAHRSIARYASWVKDMKSGPTGSEKVVYGLYATRSDQIAQCQKTFAQTAAMKPALPKLDAAGTGYIAALMAMDKLVVEANTYYDRENYKDDQFAKGRALHAPLAASFEAFKAASSAFSDALDAENDILLDARLAEVEKTQGRKLAYFQMSLMSQAKHLSRTVGEETFDVPKAVQQLAAFEKIADEAQAYAKAHAGEVPMNWFTLDSASEDYRKAAKERVRRLRDNVPYSQGEKMMLKPGSAWMVEGSTEKLVKAYNGLVTASNNL